MHIIIQTKKAILNRTQNVIAPVETLKVEIFTLFISDFFYQNWPNLCLKIALRWPF